MRGAHRLVVAGLAVAALVVAGAVPPADAQGEWKAPAADKGKTNPEKGKPVSAAARKSAETNCAMCHGAGGKGDGAASAALTPKPADWTSAKVQGQTDGELFWKLTNGRGAMPPWKHLAEKERWELVNLVRSLKK